jgi:hypothetical protein
VDGRGGCQEAEDGGGPPASEFCCWADFQAQPVYSIRIKIFKLAKYFSLEALPASRLDAGDVDKLEY